jgi:hypothetical protein
VSPPALPDSELAPSAPVDPSSRPPSPPPPAPLPLDDPKAAATTRTTLLRTARRYESAHLGALGAPSVNAASLRTVLAHPRGAALLHELLERATTAGRVYAAAGLYFADPPSFDDAVRVVGSIDEEIPMQLGCSVFDANVSTLVRRRGALEVHRGETVDAASKRQPGLAQCDLTGGCLPLSLVEGDAAAPRGPARR